MNWELGIFSWVKHYSRYRKLLIWSDLLKNFLMVNYFFCAVKRSQRTTKTKQTTVIKCWEKNLQNTPSQMLDRVRIRLGSLNFNFYKSMETNIFQHQMVAHVSLSSTKYCLTDLPTDLPINFWETLRETTIVKSGL